MPPQPGIPPLCNGGIRLTCARPRRCLARPLSSPRRGSLNIYTARITEGLLVSSPGNSKLLNSTVQSTFALSVQNSTPQTASYRLTIRSQPVGAKASFLQDPLPPAPPLPPLTTLDVTIARRSSVSRPIFVTSSNSRASVT